MLAEDRYAAQARQTMLGDMIDPPRAAPGAEAAVKMQIKAAKEAAKKRITALAKTMQKLAARKGKVLGARQRGIDVLGGDAGEDNLTDERRKNLEIKERLVPTKERTIISKDEGGNRAKSYMDSKDNLTGGVGHLMTDAEKERYPEGTKIPKSVRDGWFQQDMMGARVQAFDLMPDNAPTEVFDIVTNMVFNMGKGIPPHVDENGEKVKGTGVQGFQGMLGAIKAGDYERAALEMEWVNPDAATKTHTDWYNQTGRRAKRLIKRMRDVS
jgi:GH24 family phage-related lysozyme (muramidase)